MSALSATLTHSKSCGGVMRTAPVGLIFRGSEAFLHIEKIENRREIESLAAEVYEIWGVKG